MHRVPSLTFVLLVWMRFAPGCEAGFWPIDQPIAVMEKLIAQGGTFRGHSVSEPGDVCELTVTRSDEAGGGLPYHVYHVEIVLKRKDGTVRKSLRAELYTVRDMDWSDREITMHIRHPAHVPETRWRLSLDANGRLVRAWAQRVRLFGWVQDRALEGVFAEPRAERFKELHRELGTR